MNILALDTSFAACSVAVAHVATAAAERPCRIDVHGLFEPMQTGHAERLVPMIAEVLDDAGLQITDIDILAVANGPGSFTGTRIAVAAARALALSLPASKVVAASTLAAMAEGAVRQLLAAGEPPTTSADLVVAVDARRGEVYAQRFSPRDDGAGADANSEPMLLSIEAAAGLGGMRSVTFCGSGAAEVAAHARTIGRDAEAHLPDLLPDARDLARLAARLEPAAAPVGPLYLRPADAKPQAGKSIERAHP